MGWTETCVEPVRGKESGIKQGQEGVNEEVQKRQLSKQLFSLVMVHYKHPLSCSFP